MNVCMIVEEKYWWTGERKVEKEESLDQLIGG